MFTKPSRKVHRVFIHCSASDHAHHDNIETMKSWHSARGFSDVGYHFFIQKDGIFGPQTSRSIKVFKKLHKLYASDLVKSHIWRLLMENERVEH